jgi:hypothetical protein
LNLEMVEILEGSVADFPGFQKYKHANTAVKNQLYGPTPTIA